LVHPAQRHAHQRRRGRPQGGLRQDPGRSEAAHALAGRRVPADRRVPVRRHPGHTASTASCGAQGLLVHHTMFWRPGMVLGRRAASSTPSSPPACTWRPTAACWAPVHQTRVAGRLDEQPSSTSSRTATSRVTASLDSDVLLRHARDESSYFWSAKKVTSNSYTEQESFVDLVAAIPRPTSSSPTPSGRAAFQAALDRVRRRDRQRVQEKDQNMGRCSVSVVRQAMREAGRCRPGRCSARTPAPRRRRSRAAVVASDDGMFWETRAS